jgi:hypothetical protein
MHVFKTGPQALFICIAATGSEPFVFVFYVIIISVFISEEKDSMIYVKKPVRTKTNNMLFPFLC